MNAKTRNDTVDIFRLVACFFIVFLHVQFVRPDQSIISIIYLETRWGVPFFLMLSGFYLQPALEKSSVTTLKHTGRKLISIMIVANIVYIPVSLIKDGVFYKWNYLIYGNHFHLWFLTSLLLSTIVMFLLQRFKVKSWISVLLMVIVFSASLVMDSYSSFFGLHTQHYFTTWVHPVVTLPYVLIGSYFYKFSWLQKFMKPWIGLLFVFGGYILQLMEAIVINFYSGRGANKHDILAGMAFFAVGVFILAFTVPLKSSRLARWGRDYALYIYLFHPLVAFIFEHKGWNYLFQGNLMLAYPVLIFAITMSSAMFLDKYINPFFLILTGSFDKVISFYIPPRKAVVKDITS